MTDTASARRQPPAHRDFVPLAFLLLLVAMLVGSVLVPALETRRIVRLLSEITEVIEPARDHSRKLESGLALEYSALQGYALLGDSVLLRQYRARAEANERQLASLEQLAPRLGPGTVDEVADVRRRIAEWQQLNHALFDGQPSREQFAVAARGQRALRDSVLGAIDRLPTELSDEILTRRREVVAHERQGLYVNAGLVLAALAAMVVVIVLTLRERKLAAILQRRVEYEGALREAAEALAEAFTMEDVTRQIVRSALDATRASGVYVRLVETAPDGSAILVVRGVVGSDTPAVGAVRPYLGSYAERAITAGRPMFMQDMAPVATDDRVDATVVLPIEHSGRPVGALFIVGASPEHFRSADITWARTFDHLAALAYEKVRLLDEAHGSRRELERVMSSRQRLMRGFSHDVKNPLGAADGYAELLSAGIFGEVTGAQRDSVESLRRSIRRALALIDDLHELARAETGSVELRREPVHLGELVRSTGEEYRGAAHANGLALQVDAPDELPIIVSDGGRLQQIVGNLLSNAIKYTPAGSVILRARAHPLAMRGGVEGWVHVEVIDTGVGIPADKQDLIFEEFRRLGVGDKPGAGLGLAISERLAEALGGQISVESEVGRGSTFTLRLPMQAPDSSQPVTLSAHGSRHTVPHSAISPRAAFGPQLPAG
jgi:signal transduction histidine kinase